jgi:hypothetical protein
MLLDLRGLNCSLPGRSATGRSNAPIRSPTSIFFRTRPATRWSAWMRRMASFFICISIAAITYYLLSILHLIFEGLHRKIDAFDSVVATALSVPLLLALILWMFRRRGKTRPGG